MSEEPEPEQGPELSPIERLRAEGSVIEGSGTWDDTPPLPADENGPSLTEILAEMRADER